MYYLSIIPNTDQSDVRCCLNVLSSRHNELVRTLVEKGHHLEAPKHAPKRPKGRSNSLLTSDRITSMFSACYEN